MIGDIDDIARLAVRQAGGQRLAQLDRRPQVDIHVGVPGLAGSFLQAIIFEDGRIIDQAGDRPAGGDGLDRKPVYVGIVVKISGDDIGVAPGLGQAAAQRVRLACRIAVMDADRPAVFSKGRRDFAADAFCGAGNQRMSFGCFGHIVKMRYVGNPFKGLRVEYTIAPASPVRSACRSCRGTGWR